VLVGLPEDHFHFVEREILLAEELHMLVLKTGLPSFVVPLLNPLPVNIGHPVALVAEDFGSFSNCRRASTIMMRPRCWRLFVSQQPDVGENAVL